MSTPLVATWRIALTYTVSGLTHKLHLYVKMTSTVSPYTVRLADASSISDANAIESLANSLNGCLGNFGSASLVTTGELQQLVSGAWLPRTTISNPVTSALNGNSPATGYQYTGIFRGVGPKKVKVVVIEPSVGVLSHSSVIANTPGTVQNLNYAWNNPISPATEAPITFIVGRDNNYLADPGTFQAGTITSNRRVRRRRGLA